MRLRREGAGLMPTKIAWTDESWNPVTGCTPVSEGCAHCYAKRDSKRWGRSFDVALHPDRLDKPLRWRKPRMVFVPSMGDLWHEDVPTEFIDDVFAAMVLSRGHTFQALTKRVGRMAKYARGVATDMESWPLPVERGHARIRLVTLAQSVSDWPLPNVWLGVSVENQARADERIPLLLETPAAVRFVSAEPLLGPLNLGAAGALPVYREAETVTEYSSGKADYIPYKRPGRGWQRFDGFGPFLDWVICGGESSGPPERRLVKEICECGDWREQHENGSGRCVLGSGCRPGHCRKYRSFGWDPKPEALEWVRDIRGQCQAAGVPFFLKQWGPRAGQGTLLDGREHKEMPEVRA